MRIHGCTQPWSYDERTGLVVPRRVTRNLNLYTWGQIAAQCIGFGDTRFKVSAMYLEFENVADPEDTVTVPDFERADGMEYYDNLQSSEDKDFLRVALQQGPLLGTVTGYEDYFTAGQGNKLTFSAMSSGVEGVHGKDFSNSVNSKVYGAALVATPVFADRTQDVLFARVYYEPEDQIPKLTSGQIGITWAIGFDEAL